MSNLGKKLSSAANQVTGAVVKAGARQGKTGMTVANAVCYALLGTYVKICDDGLDCTHPDHEHVGFQLYER